MILIAPMFKSAPLWLELACLAGLVALLAYIIVPELRYALRRKDR